MVSYVPTLHSIKSQDNILHSHLHGSSVVNFKVVIIHFVDMDSSWGHWGMKAGETGHNEPVSNKLKNDNKSRKRYIADKSEILVMV